MHKKNLNINTQLTSTSPNNLPCTLSDNAVKGVHPLDHRMLDPSLDTRRLVLNDSFVCSIILQVNQLLLLFHFFFFLIVARNIYTSVSWHLSK